MELTVNSKELVKGLTVAMGAVDSKPAMPILANVVLTCAKDMLVVGASDTLNHISGNVPAAVKDSGSCAVNAKYFFEIAKALPDGDIHLKLDTAQLVVKCGKVKYKINSVSTADFPAQVVVNEDVLFSASSTGLIQAIEKTLFATSVDECRPILNGCLLHTHDDLTCVVATDGHRLSLYKSKVFDGELLDKVIIPRKGLVALKKLLDGTNECKLGLVDGQLVAKTHQCTMVMRLIDGSFPDYASVIPSNYENVMKVDRVALIKALNRIGIMSGSTRCVHLHVSDHLSIVSSSADLGDAKEDIDCSYDGKELTVGCNSQFLIDALQAVATPSVIVKFIDALSPICIVPDGFDHQLELVSPMKI